VASRLRLHHVHAELGARFDAPCGWELPFSYGDIEGEYRAARERVGLVDRSLMEVIEVAGRDRGAFLHGMLTNDVKGLRPGQGCPAALLDAHAKVQALLTVLALDDRFLLLMSAGLAAKTLQTLDKFLISEKASLRDLSAEAALFMLVGPRAGAVAERLTGTRPPAGAWAHVKGQAAGATVRLIAGDGETGEAEAWVLAPAAAGEAVWRALLEAGRPEGLRPLGVTALDVLRVEAGTPWYGHDVDETVLLPEIPSGAYVSATKGCYVGQEIVARVRSRGHVNRSLTGLTLDGDRVPKAGALILAEEREVGRVTSAVRSLALGRPIALGFVRREHLEPGTPLAVRDGDALLAARVTTPPFRSRSGA
jgi:folate-binding protein YgfZ